MERTQKEINSILQDNDIIRYEELEQQADGLTASIGKNAAGDTIKLDFLKNPHLLIRRFVRFWKINAYKLHFKKLAKQ